MHRSVSLVQKKHWDVILNGAKVPWKQPIDDLIILKEHIISRSYWCSHTVRLSLWCTPCTVGHLSTEKCWVLETWGILGSSIWKWPGFYATMSPPSAYFKQNVLTLVPQARAPASDIKLLTQCFPGHPIHACFLFIYLTSFIFLFLIWWH